MIAARLAERAQTHGDRVFLRFADGDRTYAQVDADATQMAHALAGERVVATLLGNCYEAAVLPFAAARAGAIYAPINPAFRGPGLDHVLQVTGADLLVVPESLQSLYSGNTTPIGSGHEDDLAMLLFTSGTTGRSKGCMLSHRYGPRQAQLLIEHYELRDDDVLYCPFPLFHLDALVLTVLAALELGTTAAIGARFSASGFWDEIRAFGATVFDFMGATLTILHKRPPRPDDADNPVRLAWGVPVPEWAGEFEARFGLRLVELYGSTDVGVPIYQPLHEPRVVGSCGRAIDAYEVELIDGEIAVRGREPGLISDGYYGMPEATSWRDGWFMTGDLATRDAAGNFFFAGRRKEAIRRRGENISAFEVEEVVLLHPGVLEVAAYGVPSELSEEEVMVAVVPRPGQAVDPADLVAHCERQMARHMVPRYVDVLDALPRTATEKVEKYRLVERGVTPTTWDRGGRADGPPAVYP